MRDMLLHGLRSWPSLQVTDARRPNHMYFGGSSMRGGMSSSSSSNDRSKLYGHGFSYAEWLPPPMPTWRLKEDGSGGDATNQVREDEELRSSDMPSSFPRSKNQLPWQRMEPLRAAISRRAFDLVVYGSVHRGLPFLTEVTAAYTKVKINTSPIFWWVSNVLKAVVVTSTNVDICFMGISYWFGDAKRHLDL